MIYTYTLPLVSSHLASRFIKLFILNMLEKELWIAPEQTDNKIEDIENTWYYNDPLYNLCIQLSYLNSSNSESFGAVAIQNNKGTNTIVGIGWNLYMGGKTKLKRQGYANHAEFQAAALAEGLGYNLNDPEKETRIYVAGRFVKEDTLYCSPESIAFTCLTCTKSLAKYFGKITLATPTTKRGWRHIPIQEAHNSALYFKYNKLTREDTNTMRVKVSDLNIGFEQEHMDNLINTFNELNIGVDDKLADILLSNYTDFLNLGKQARRKVIEDMIEPRYITLRKLGQGSIYKKSGENGKTRED